MEDAGSRLCWENGRRHASVTKDKPNHWLFTMYSKAASPDPVIRY